MNYILFDSFGRDSLLPFTFTRPVADIRVGILTIREKWEFYLKSATSSLTQQYLNPKFPIQKEKDNLLINGSVFPTTRLVKKIAELEPGQILAKGEIIIAMRVEESQIDDFASQEIDSTIEWEEEMVKLNENWEIFSFNPTAIVEDFKLITAGRKSQPLSKTNFVTGDPKLIFLEEGARSEFAFLNTTDGPIYIGKEAEIMEGSKVRGPFALCEHAHLKMDAKIYGGTTVGPYSKVGGEVSNSVIFGYTNKGHDGFLGNSVLGEWCNLGADTNTSNLKNTYDIVRLWSYDKESFVSTGLQFCGLIMGDHSKSGINTMFNTGTVVGVSCNLYGAGFQRNFVPSFSWGSPSGMKSYNFTKAVQVAEAVYKRRNKEFDQKEKDIFEFLYNLNAD
ncbi:MAG: glucose-1-phosphate thymidylyltransferase [Bacteroidetes bacterium HGW-Bacteroidetes-16]|jgi:UDP-N-acetylglucosamine diphosphorylase/glucosamine-1-phosphate N-acetyltransferase|nr:MAG: glucose-1-phosphate thymidylyltransferase [Bacteroidetes bacterium HGW-Bacteroidetes-16]